MNNKLSSTRTTRSKNNDSVTVDTNVTQYRCKTPKLQEFYDEGLRINLEEGIEFTCKDFPHLSSGNFRQKIHQLRDVIEVTDRSSVGFYKVKGVLLSRKRRPITTEHTGLGINMLPILRSLRKQPPAIHNVTVKTTDSKLHQILKEKGFKEDPNNRMIYLPLNFTGLNAKISIYPNGTVLIHLACTLKPLAYSIEGVQNMLFFLGRLYQHLVLLTDNMMDMPYPQKWIVTRYEFGKDSKEVISGPRFEHTLEDLTGGLIRFYSKTMESGKQILRIETIQTPNRLIDDEIKLMIAQDTQGSENVI